MKICSNCRWFIQDNGTAVCGHPSNADPVYGGVDRIYCINMRQPTGTCGLEGRLFEGKVSNGPEVIYTGNSVIDKQ